LPSRYMVAFAILFLAANADCLPLKIMLNYASPWDSFTS